MLEKRNTETLPKVTLEMSLALVQMGQRLDARGWVPATGGNLSARLPEAQVAITVSGRHKGYLTQDDIMAVDMATRPEFPHVKTFHDIKLHPALAA